MEAKKIAVSVKTDGFYVTYMICIDSLTGPCGGLVLLIWIAAFHHENCRLLFGWFLQNQLSIQIQRFGLDKINQVMLLTDIRHINLVYTFAYPR